VSTLYANFITSTDTTILTREVATVRVEFAVISAVSFLTGAKLNDFVLSTIVISPYFSCRAVSTTVTLQSATVRLDFAVISAESFLTGAKLNVLSTIVISSPYVSFRAVSTTVTLQSALSVEGFKLTVAASIPNRAVAIVSIGLGVLLLVKFSIPKPAAGASILTRTRLGTDFSHPFLRALTILVRRGFIIIL
jgi:hypothetical protein